MMKLTNVLKSLSFNKIKPNILIKSCVKDFSLSLKNVQQENFQLREKNHQETFYADELELKDYAKKSLSVSKVTGEYLNTDLIFEVDYNEKTGWKSPRISGFHKLEIDPRNSVLHYAVQTFEGISVRRNQNQENKIMMFRPDCHIQRLKNSADRLGFPQFEANELIQCMKKLVELEKEYVPKDVENFMYIRPTYISMTDQLGVLPATSAKLFMIMSTVQAKKNKPLKLLCTENIIKKYPKSFGHLNLGSNLGPILEELKLAREKGYDDILFLLNDNLTELCDMNVFVYWENENGTKELLTPAMDGTVLPGITRDSVIKIGKDSGVQVTERHISIKEIIKAISDKRTLELFATSTLNGITSIQEINYDNEVYKLPGQSLFTQFIYNNLLKIQTSAEEHPWITIVD